MRRIYQTYQHAKLQTIVLQFSEAWLNCQLHLSSLKQQRRRKKGKIGVIKKSHDALKIQNKITGTYALRTETHFTG